NLAEVLGLEEVVSEPWSTATSTTMAAEDLKDLLNSGNPAHFERLAEFGLIAPKGDEAHPKQYTILDQETVSAYGRLVKLGLPLSGI
ncbi:MerR family transcriptional regulator, partial [Streptomyces sp. SID10244]|nr:MerR family transcriptional regulator [Streptomyces sp. SID10244]